MINYGTCTICGWKAQNRDENGVCPGCQPKKEWVPNNGPD